MMKKIFRQIWMTLMAIFAITGISCEREQFLLYDDYEPGEPVNIMLGFELPQKETMAITRGMTVKDEHNVSDFYLLVFDSKGNRVFGKYYTSSEMQLTQFSGEDGKYKSVGEAETPGDDGDPTVDSTHGYFLAQAVKEECYIYGFANIGDTYDDDATDKLEGKAVDPNDPTKLLSSRAMLDAVQTVDELFSRKMDVMRGEKRAEYDEGLLDRMDANLLYSGSWKKYDDVISLIKPNFDATPPPGYDRTKTAGYVNLKEGDPQSILPDVEIKNGEESTGNLDLTRKGMIYLRSLIAHVKFEITVDKNQFSDFKPTSWQVVNLPTRAFLMDRGTITKTSGDEEFTASAANPYMVNSKGSYNFDFYMFENHKGPRAVSEWNAELQSLAANGRQEDPNDTSRRIKDSKYTDDGSLVGAKPLGVSKKKNGEGNYIEPADIQTYFTDYFGSDMTNTGMDKWYSKLKLVYENDEKQLKYAKRDLKLKNRDYQILRNREDGPADDHYESMNFVYVEPKATYVVIKGRLLFKTGTSIKNKASGLGGVDGHELVETVDSGINDAYADVTYTIHLGYAKMKENDQHVLVYDEENGTSEPTDFNILRNTEYTYSINIKGVDNIYTNVKSNIQVTLEDESTVTYRVKKQTGADGFVNIAFGEVFKADAHYNQFNFMLTKAALETFYFEIHTPWNDISSGLVKQDIQENIFDKIDMSSMTGEGAGAALLAAMEDKVTAYKLTDDYKNKYEFNPDFNWFKFRPCYDQTGMLEIKKEGETDEEFKQRLKTILPELNKGRLTTRYKFDRYESYLQPVWNLFDFMIELAKLAPIAYVDGSGNPITIQVPDNGFDYAVRSYNRDTGVADKPLSANQHSPFLTDNINRMFYTAYLDEYYYGDDYGDYASAYGHAEYALPYIIKAGTRASWTKPYWHEFVNVPSRYVIFGYGGAEAAATGSSTVWSLDRESSVTSTQLTIVQQSIQTYYSTDKTKATEVAMGLEHSNETHDPRWTDLAYLYPDSLTESVTVEQRSIPTSGLDSYFGWKTAKAYIVDKNIPYWDYVSPFTYDDINGLNTNVGMKRSGNKPTAATRKNAVTETTSENPYLAGAIRMCMNRNRDEDGDGFISEKELKWYLPASTQIDFASMCHFSLSDPLYNYNDNYVPGKEDFQRLPKVINYYDGTQGNTTEFKVNNYAKYHYITSDYHNLTSEELTNTPRYDQGTGATSRSYEMRCVRKLGPSTPDEDPEKIYTYDSDSHIFEMHDVDRRSLRAKYLGARELDLPHYQFSEWNLPYSKFEVARNLVIIKWNQSLFDKLKSQIKDNALVIDAFPQTKYPYGIPLKTVMESKPCLNYTQETGGVDKESWRTPNHAELALMAMVLRDTNTTGQGKVLEYDTPWFFSADNNLQVFSCTSWNYTGPWGRLLGTKFDGTGGWGIYSSDAYKWYDNPDTHYVDPDPDDDNHYYYPTSNLSAVWNIYDDNKPYGYSLRNTVNIAIRCVRDRK